MSKIIDAFNQIDLNDLDPFYNSRNKIQLEDVKSNLKQWAGILTEALNNNSLLLIGVS